MSPQSRLISTATGGAERRCKERGEEEEGEKEKKKKRGMVHCKNVGQAHSFILALTHVTRRTLESRLEVLCLNSRQGNQKHFHAKSLTTSVFFSWLLYCASAENLMAAQKAQEIFN